MNRPRAMPVLAVPTTLALMLAPVMATAAPEPEAQPVAAQEATSAGAAQPAGVQTASVQTTATAQAPSTQAGAQPDGAQEVAQLAVAQPSAAQETAPAAAPPAPAPLLPASPPSAPPLTFRLQVRVNTLAKGGPRHTLLDDYRLDSILAVPGVGGQLSPWFSYVFSAVGYAENFDSAQAKLLDAAGMFKVADSFQIWAGRFVVPFDRFNLSGPFRNLIWDYPGLYGGVRRVGGENGPFGRDTGLSIWGSVAKGLFKYHLMAHQLERSEVAPRFTGRVSVSLLDREPGYFVQSSYLGEKDVLAFGVAMQYQHKGRTWTPAPAPGAPPLPTGTPAPTQLDNLSAVTADVFAEKNFGTAGTGTFDAAYYHYDEHRPYRRAFAITAAYLPPLKLGPGKTQLGVRWEQAYASSFSPQLSDVRGVDLSASYFLNGYNLRIGLDVARQWLGSAGGVSNSVSAGFQYSPQ
ncbi:hypothetical protein JY651_37320 [Pyxidicoccus parkwayensis]|uniref:Uncharacterized protein n=1 Tax=Pyxidicoccus parkwayensis TaxID=2813578 RepID=A0ABX7NQZ1_9BACT|nr:hypothetical protein [Pyxidicoccus parkwaysis]QSQ20848.1 hypothetical protein JY651_37320 [Pyxidicoccus parkwaysis]